MIIQIHLLELLSQSMRCNYLSDLRFLDDTQRRILCRKLDRIEAKEQDLKDWNDTLKYLTDLAPVHNAEAAKNILIDALLRAPCAPEGG